MYNSAATALGYVYVFSNDFITYWLQSVMVKEFLKFIQHVEFLALHRTCKINMQ